LLNPALTSVLKTQLTREPFEELLTVPASQGIDALAGIGKLRPMRTNPAACTVTVNPSIERFIIDISFRDYSYIIPP
jgi:hypothetical protein